MSAVSTSRAAGARRCCSGSSTALVAELRRRLGGRFYGRSWSRSTGSGTSWCLQLAMDIAPEDPWAWDSRVVVDAAFARYLR